MSSNFPRSRSFLTVTLIFLAALAQAESSTRHQLRVQLCDATGFPPQTHELIGREVRAIFNETGIDLVWICGCGMEPLESDFSYVARVYILHEIPRPLLSKVQKAGAHGPRVLGWSLCQEGEAPGPVVYLSRSSIVSLASRGGADRLTEPQMARALGRVVTHELAHRFLREEGHTTFGVLKAVFDRQSLIGFDPRAFRFTARQAARLQAVADLRLAARLSSTASPPAK